MSRFDQSSRSKSPNLQRQRERDRPQPHELAPLHRGGVPVVRGGVGAGRRGGPAALQVRGGARVGGVHGPDHLRAGGQRQRAAGQGALLQVGRTKCIRNASFSGRSPVIIWNLEYTAQVAKVMRKAPCYLPCRNSRKKLAKFTMAPQSGREVAGGPAPQRVRGYAQFSSRFAFRSRSLSLTPSHFPPPRHACVAYFRPGPGPQISLFRLPLEREWRRGLKKSLTLMPRLTLFPFLAFVGQNFSKGT